METDHFPNDRNSDWKKNISADLSKHMLLLLFAPNDSNFQIIDLLVPPRAAGVAGTLIFVHITNFATLQPWLHVGSFTCRILIHCIRTRDLYFYVPLRDTELCD